MMETVNGKCGQCKNTWKPASFKLERLEYENQYISRKKPASPPQNLSYWGHAFHKLLGQCLGNIERRFFDCQKPGKNLADPGGNRSETSWKKVRWGAYEPGGNVAETWWKPGKGRRNQKSGLAIEGFWEAARSVPSQVSAKPTPSPRQDPSQLLAIQAVSFQDCSNAGVLARGRQLLEQLRCEIKVRASNLSAPMRWRPLAASLARDKGIFQRRYASGARQWIIEVMPPTSQPGSK